MKRYILIVAAVALATVSCSRNYDVNPSGEGTAIGFGTWTDVLTKAARVTGNDNKAFANGESFDVFGYKTVGTTDHSVFNGDDVTATVDGTTVTWDYATHRFWDPAAASYTFFAVLPSGNLKDETTGGYDLAGKFVSNDIVFDDPTAFSNDVLIADKTVKAGTGSAAPYSYTEKVNLKFNHAATCVDLKVKQDKELGDAVVKVTALSLLNIHNKGHFTVSGYASSEPFTPTIDWAEATTPTTLGTSGVYEILKASDAADDVTVAGKSEYKDDHSINTTTDTPATLFENYVFMPQGITAGTQKIRISYTIQVGSEEPNVYENVEFDIRDFMQTDTDNNGGTNITSWDKSTHYIYFITIGANVIEFTAEVKNWATTDVNGYHYLLN